MLLRQPATPTNAPASALPVDVRLMNAIAAVVFTLALVALAGARASAWAARRPQFQFGDVRLEGDLQRNSVTTVRANAMPHLAGNFFTMDLASARAAFEQVPWVRHAVVRRVWPNRLVVVARGAPARRAVGRATRTATRWSTATARSSRPTSATSRTTACRSSPARTARRRRCWTCTAACSRCSPAWTPR